MVGTDANSQSMEYSIKIVKSPVPYYTVGAFWLVYAAFFPMYLWYHYVIAGAVSIGVYFLLIKLFPAKQIKVAIPKKLEFSGQPDVDKLIKKADESIKKIENTAAAIKPKNSELAAEVMLLVNSGYKILAYLAKNPDKASLIRRFINYYLPTLEKLLESYLEFKIHQTAPETVLEIEKTVKAMKDVFQKQIDKLLMDRELDISTDIDVLESMLEGDGLNGIKMKK